MSTAELHELWVLIVRPLLQIAVLYLVLYWLLRTLQRISAAVKLKGLAVTIALIVVTALVAQFLQLHAINWLMQSAISFSAIILAIVFQPELRRLFTRMGGWIPNSGGADHGVILDQLRDAIEFMSKKHIGALMVFERNDRLDNYIESSPLDCEITAKSLATIFWKDTPLHDGAVIIRGGRVAAAGVILPLTENFEYRHLSGTRHRAGIGISEETDAFAILVSEETGAVSVADKGRFQQDLTRDDLGIVLGRLFGVLGVRGGRGGG